MPSFASYSINNIRVVINTVLTETGGKSHFCVFLWLNDNGDPGASGAGSMRCPAALQPRSHQSGTPQAVLFVRAPPLAAPRRC